MAQIEEKAEVSADAAIPSLNSKLNGYETTNASSLTDMIAQANSNSSYLSIGDAISLLS